MSVVDHRNVKLDLHRSGPDLFWQLMGEWAGDDALRWKYLGMLALRENAGWSMSAIGLAFGHDRGHVCRCIASVKQQIRRQCELEPDYTPAGDRAA
ncbi:MAG: hypothetical protein WBC44_14560 [Planctomycetaceae bacterium]